jgi:ribose 5-phosphate isomerase B
MRLAIASDHAGYLLKSFLKAGLVKEADLLVDLGCSSEEPVDYPQYAKIMAEALARGDAEFGILVCGSGIGISIAANRFTGVRAALVSDPLGARLAREHNNANVICLGGKVLGEQQALECVRTFLQTSYVGGRHQHRVEMLDAIGGSSASLGPSGT